MPPPKAKKTKVPTGDYGIPKRRKQAVGGVSGFRAMMDAFKARIGS